MGMPPARRRRSHGNAARDKGYLAHVAAERGHHPARIPLHPLHQPMVPGAPRGIQRGMERALPGRGREEAGKRPG